MNLADATLQAVADTMIPGRKAKLTDLGNEIHPKAIAGVHSEPGAVEADALFLYHHPLIGFDALEPAFLADLEARSLPAPRAVPRPDVREPHRGHEGRPRGEQPVRAGLGGGRWPCPSRRSWRRPTQVNAQIDTRRATR